MDADSEETILTSLGTEFFYIPGHGVLSQESVIDIRC
jgi:hypothetical protein